MLSEQSTVRCKVCEEHSVSRVQLTTSLSKRQPIYHVRRDLIQVGKSLGHIAGLLNDHIFVHEHFALLVVFRRTGIFRL